MTMAMAEVEVEEVEDVGDESKRTKPRILPPYQVVVLNDDVHSVQYVLDTFRKILGYAVERCYQLTHDVHHKGRAVVWTGPKEVAELKMDQLKSVAPEISAKGGHVPPLRVIIEPMPQ